MGIIGWIVLGFLAGVIGKALVSGDEGIGFILTTILGIVGAIAGGLVATALGFGDPVDEFFDLSHLARGHHRVGDDPARLARDCGRT